MANTISIGFRSGEYGGKVQQRRSGSLDRRFDPGHFVHWEVVHDDNIVRRMAEEIGLDRHQKCVCLGALEAEDYVTVEQIGKKNPRVTVRPWPTEALLL